MKNPGTTKSMKFNAEQGMHSSLPLVISLSAGFALFWFTFYIALFCNPVLSASKTNARAPLPFTFLCGLVCIMLIGLKWPAGLMATKRRRILQILICASPAIIGALLFASYLSAFSIPEAAALAAGFLSGIGAGALLFLWMELIFLLSDNLELKILCWSMALGAFFYYVASALPKGLSIFLVFAASPTSLILLEVLKRSSGSFTAPKANRNKNEARPFVPFVPFFALIILYGIVFGIAISFHSDAENTTVENILITASIIVAAFITLKAFHANTEKRYCLFVVKALFPLCIIFLLVIPSAAMPLPSGISFILLSCWACFMLVALYLSHVTAKNNESVVIASVGKHIAPIAAGVGCGYMIGYAFSSLNLYDPNATRYVANIIIVAFVIAIAAAPSSVFNPQSQNNNTEKPSGQAPEVHKGRWRRRCEAIVARYELSPRETEVFYLLIKGWGSKYIESKLYLSPSTVKTHRYNIYKKMNVKSREEILAIIEASDEETELIGE